MTAGTTPSATPEATAPRRWTKVLFVASLAINLLVVGAIGAALIGAHRGVGLFGGPVVGSPNLLAFLRTLPHERRDSIWHATASERKGLLPLRKELRRMRDDVHRAIVSEPFDQEKFAAAVKAFDETEARLRQSAQGLIVAVANRLTPDERLAYVKWHAKFRRGPKRPGRDHGNDDAASATDTPSTSAPAKP
jgi:Spy/CpxP family protein refolding chaperone